MSVGDTVKLEGWLVIIDYRLFLIPEDYKDDYVNNEKIEISSPEIIFSVMEKVLPLAGDSFIFHRAKLSGVLIELSPMRIKPIALFVEERGLGFISIDLDGGDTEKHKAQYESFISKRRIIKSDDWLDYL